MQELCSAPAEASAQAPCWQGGSPMSSPQPPVMRRSTLVTPRGIRNSSLALVVFGLPLTQPLKASHLAGGAVLDLRAEFTAAHLEAALGTGPSELKWQPAGFPAGRPQLESGAPGTGTCQALWGLLWAVLGRMVVRRPECSPIRREPGHSELLSLSGPRPVMPECEVKASRCLSTPGQGRWRQPASHSHVCGQRAGSRKRRRLRTQREA